MCSGGRRGQDSGIFLAVEGEEVSVLQSEGEEVSVLQSEPGVQRAWTDGSLLVNI